MLTIILLIAFVVVDSLAESATQRVEQINNGAFVKKVKQTRKVALIIAFGLQAALAVVYSLSFVEVFNCVFGFSIVVFLIQIVVATVIITTHKG